MKKNISFLGYDLKVEIKKRRVRRKIEQTDPGRTETLKLNFGPGPNWQKPDTTWQSVDIDPALGDIVVNFQQFERLPLEDFSVNCVYGSHVFEHISIFKSQLVFDEIFRVLKKGGVFRLVLPDAEKSIQEYLSKNEDFLLFKRRKERAKERYGIDYTIFECMKEDFLSPNGQIDLLGKDTLAHQNAWDFEAIKANLERAGFQPDQITRANFKKSQSPDFSFEGTYPSEANEDYRSLYVEAVK